ncbi:MAG: ABC transporter permease [Alphaproteobacteria bacterium]|nr:ABC transporter permease [Alphaproteobacteria bacterium]
MWESTARLGQWSSLVLPAPSVVAQAWWQSWSNGFFVAHVGQTLIEVALGWVLGSVFGFAAGVALGESEHWRRILLPYVVASQVTPKLALAPLLLLWMGFGTWPLVVITALVCFFPLLENTLTCMRHVDRQSLDLFRLMHASRWQTLWLLKVPAGLPGIMTGLRVALVLAWVGAIVGEFIGATHGLGALIIAAQGSMDTPLMFAVLINITVLGWLTYQALWALEQHLLRHREPAPKDEFNAINPMS